MRPRSEAVSCVVDRQAGWITLGKAGSTFVLNQAAIAALVEAVWRLDTDPAVRVLVLRSADPETFCAGGDLTELRAGAVPPRPGAYGAVSAAEVLFGARKPVVCEVSGLAAGGGLELVLASDIVVCAGSARFMVAEGLRGTGGLIVAQLIGRAVPRRVAFDLLYSARAVPAPEALALGLVNSVHDGADLALATDRWVDTIAAKAPLTMQAHRAAMNYLIDLPLPAATRTPLLPDPYASNDMRRGIDAFFDRTEPEWEGD